MGPKIASLGSCLILFLLMAGCSKEEIPTVVPPKPSCECPMYEAPTCKPFEDLGSEVFTLDGCNNTCSRPICVRQPFVPNSDRIFACETDEDCVLVPDSCCAQANCGYRAINKAYEQEWLADFEDRCTNNMMCAAVLCPRTRYLEPKCKERFDDEQRPVYKQCTIVDEIGVTVPSDEQLSKVNVDNAMFVLQRGPCFGTCQSYTVTIYANGTAYYDGGLYAERQGLHYGIADKLQIQRLIWMFEYTPFSSFENEYSADITDMQTVTTTYRYGGKTKTVSNYAGGAPVALELLEDEIDRTTHSMGWSLVNETSK